METDWIDRKTLQEILGVSKTVAWRLFRLCGAVPGPGNTLVCPRESLAAALRSLEASGTCEREIRRRGRLEQNLNGLSRPLTPG